MSPWRQDGSPKKRVHYIVIYNDWMGKHWLVKSKRKLIAIMMIMHEFFDERKREKIETNKKTHSMGRKGNYSLCLHSHRTFISILFFIPTSFYSGCTVLHAIWFRRCVVSMDHVRHTCMHWIIWLWLDIPSVVRVCCFCFSYTWCLYFRFPLCFVFSVISQYGVCIAYVRHLFCPKCNRIPL